ncbi:MAG TPA: hypothetical protein VMS31_09470 [Pyrinomonadaceae bacterium]|nr:hypothetical protein [Pyrinomonadaceae bacterium]
METVAGVFNTRADAERALHGLRAAGIAEDRIAFLTPGTNDSAVEASVPTSETEQSGMGSAMGGTVGGAMGVAGGASLGAAAASLLIPGIGPVIAGGIIGAALLGAGGAVTGAAAGAAMEEGLADGIPHDELYLYEDALRKGRSVVIAFSQDDDVVETAHNVMAQAGAESIDAAKEDWWLGLRDVEEENYRGIGGDFSTDESAYRRGFEAALHARRRGKAYDQVSTELNASAQEVGSEEAFRKGYERGQAYSASLKAATKS